jgi:hypothetical protein
MNRLDEQVLSTQPTSYEASRAQELQKIQSKFTHGLDIHSTLNPSTPMIIVVNNKTPQLYYAGFPIKTTIENMTVVQR